MATNYTFQRDVLDTLTASGGSLHGLLPHLFSNNINPTPTTKLTDLTEADYTGYTAGTAVTWSPAYINEDVGQAEVAAIVSFPIATADTPTESEYGLYLETPHTSVPHIDSLAVASLFDAPVQIARAGDGVTATIVYRYDGTFVAIAN